MFNDHDVRLGQDVNIGQNVKIGDNTIIYDNFEIGDNTIICNNCSIGQPINDFYYNEKYVNLQTVIGPNSLIRSHTIIYFDSIFGENFTTGHRATIREKNQVRKALFSRNAFRHSRICAIWGLLQIKQQCPYRTKFYNR